MLLIKISVWNLKEKTTTAQHWFSLVTFKLLTSTYKLKSFMTDPLKIIFDDFSV